MKDAVSEAVLKIQLEDPEAEYDESHVPLPPVYYASMLNATREEIRKNYSSVEEGILHESDFIQLKDDEFSSNIRISDTTPCFFEIKNIQTKTLIKPYLWNKMNSYKLHVRVLNIPPGGSVMLIGSYLPSFWSNQRPDKLVKTELTYDQFIESNDSYLAEEFKSTYNVYVLTKNPEQNLEEDFEFEFYIVDTTVEKGPAIRFSLYITISVGIPLMLGSLCFFEGKNITKWAKAKMAKSDKQKTGEENDEANQLNPSNRRANPGFDHFIDQDGDYQDPGDGGQIEMVPGRRGLDNINDMSQVSRKDISNHALDLNFDDNMVENQINAGNQQDGKKFV